MKKQLLTLLLGLTYLSVNAQDLSELLQKTSDDAANNDFFGSSISISGDIAVVGAEGKNLGQGAAYILYRNQGGPNNWGQIKKITASDAANNDFFGNSVSISGDIVVVGAYQNNSSGGAYIFSRNQGGADNWGQVKKITASDAATGDGFGISVSIWGEDVIVGAPSKNNSQGVVYLFSKNQGGANNWGEVKKITHTDATQFDGFGSSIAIQSGIVLVGAYLKNNVGAAYVFYQHQGGTNNWGQVKKIIASDPVNNDLFGESVHISGETVIVGAYGKNNFTGAAYIFGKNQGGTDNWGEIKKITASDAATGDRFGFSLAIEGDIALIGSYRKNSDQGAAYVFSKNSGGEANWGQTQKIVPASLGSTDRFGYAIAFSDQTAMISAYRKNNFQGAVYVFENTCSLGNTVYVNAAVSSSGDGSSWASAFKTLQEALTATNTCPNITEIWVAAGTYYPDEGPSQTNNDRNASFVMKEGVKIYGGFPNTGNPTMNDRNWWLNPTILSGDIDQNDQPNFVNRGGNAYHVVFNNDLTSAAVLDGFAIQGGQANTHMYPHENGGGMFNKNASPTIRNCTFFSNWSNVYGGGMYNENSSPTVINSSFLENRSVNYGGGVANILSSPTMINGSFSNNQANNGGGLYSENSSNPTLTNCSFSGNQADNFGGGIFTNATSQTHLSNCVLWGNSSEVSSLNGGAYTYSYTLIKGQNTVHFQGTEDPLFVNAANENLRLQACSPIINAGDNTANSTSTDLDGNARIFNSGTIDLGAYEYQAAPPVVVTPVVGITQPTQCTYNGSIALSGFLASTTYSVSYKKNNTDVAAAGHTSDAAGVVTLSGLSSGNYTEIVATYGTCVSTPVEATLNDPSNPSITLGVIPEICENASSFTVPYTATTQSPITYSISGADIVSVTDAPLTELFITVVRNNVSFSASLSFTLTVKNASGCVSDAVAGSVVLSAFPKVEITATNSDCTQDAVVTVSCKNCLAQLSYSINGSSYGVGGTSATPFTDFMPTVIEEVLPKGNKPLTPVYLSINAKNGVCVVNDSRTSAVFEAVSGCCPVLPTLNLPNTPICSNSTFNVSSTDMSNMENGIKFVYFNAPTSDPYSGGTVLGTVNFEHLSDSKKTATLSNLNLPTGTYYVYAILSSLPADASCRPSATEILIVNSAPTLTLGVVPPICVGTTSFVFPYTGTTQSPTTYSISGTGISTVTDGDLITPINVSLSTGAAGSSISFTLTVKNTTTNCVSDNITGSVVVTPLSVGGTVGNAQTICTGTSPADLLLSNQVGNIVKWQKSSNVNFTDPTTISGTSTTLTGAIIGNLTTDTYFRAVVKSGVCREANSTSAIVQINAKPTITLTVNGQTFNEGNNSILCDTDANPVNSLQFTVNTACLTGSLVWRTQIGAGTWSGWSPTLPSIQPSDNLAYTYQAACDANCPSTFTGIITLTINYRASTPQNVSLTADGTTVAAGESKTICNSEGNTLAFNATCAVGEILLYSVDGGEYSTNLPSQIVDNNFHNYRVRCRKTDTTPSCAETESAVMSLKISTAPPTPSVSITPADGCGAPTAFSGSSSCGSFTTIWYNAATNLALPGLPTTTPETTTSFYARCRNEAGCEGSISNTVTYTLTPVNQAPTVTASADVICTGTQVTISANCPNGSTAFWNTGVTTNSFQVAFSNVTKQSYWAKCIFPNGCQSPESVHKTIFWKAFDLTFINIGQSQSAIKPANDRNLWAAQFITRDAGPVLENSTEANPTIFYSENLNKTAPRYWTIHTETCNLGTDGSVTYDMLVAPEVGVPQSFNTHENNAPYLMYANREGFTELYAQNHPAYGFYQNNGSGGNTYDSGLPKGLYKLGVRYWDQKGRGSIYPSTRQPAGNVLAYQEYWFRIQSKNGVGTRAAKAGLEFSGLPLTVDRFTQISPNPVANTLHLKVNEAKGQKVNVNLLDVSGRTLLQRSFVPESNQHQEEFEVSLLVNGIYFLKVTTADKQATLKVVKVQ